MRRFSKPQGLSTSDRQAEWLASVLRRQIHYYIRGSQLPGRTELARHFGVSLRVARRAVQRLVEEGLVECRPRGGAFVLIGDPLEVAIRQVVAIPHNWPTPQVFQESLLLGADRQCAERGLRFKVVRDTPDLGEPDCLRLVARGDPLRTGWMFVHLLPPDPTLLAWRIQGVPLVLVEEGSPQQPTHTVSADVQGAIYRATETLILLGHRRIAYVGASADETLITIARLRGFRTAHRRHGLRVEQFGVWDDGVGQSPATRRMLHQRLSGPDAGRAPQSHSFAIGDPNRPTAIVAANQRIGCDVLRTCDELGLAVPAQLSVVSGGMRRRELPPELIHRLSCWDAGRPEELGRLAVDLLARAHDIPGPVNLLAGCEWIDRGSVGPPPEPRAT